MNAPSAVLMTPCATRRCSHEAATLRSRFCVACVLAKKASAGKACRGVKKRQAGKVGGMACFGAQKKKAGKQGGLAGNEADKAVASKRGLKKRCAKKALIVKKHWADLILSKDKTWEIRGSATKRRGWIHLAESAAGGKIVGRVFVEDSLPIKRKDFAKHFKRHCVADMKVVAYARIFAWVLSKAERFEKPFSYKPKPGAVIWVDL